MQNVIGFYGYLVCCIDFEKRGGTAARERAVPLCQCHLQSTTISFYEPALCCCKKIIIQFKPPLCFIAINDGHFWRVSRHYYLMFIFDYHKREFILECSCLCTSTSMLLISFVYTKAMSTLLFFLLLPR